MFRMRLKRFCSGRPEKISALRGNEFHGPKLGMCAGRTLRPRCITTHLAPPPSGALFRNASFWATPAGLLRRGFALSLFHERPSTTFEHRSSVLNSRPQVQFDRAICEFRAPYCIRAQSLEWRASLPGRARHYYRTALNNTPTTVPTMYMAQAERLRWVFVEVNIKYSPRSAIPKLLADASFAT